MVNYLDLYPNIINARLKKYTQKDLAEEFGINQQEISRYETGKIKAPINYIIDLATACNVSIDYITGLSNDNKKLTDLEPDEKMILEKYKNLTERQKGKIELLLEQMKEENEESNAKTQDVG